MIDDLKKIKESPDKEIAKNSFGNINYKRKETYSNATDGWKMIYRIFLLFWILITQSAKVSTP